MSRIYYSTITLKHLVESSDGIIEAQKSDPFAVTEDIPIHEDTETYPPFKKTKSQDSAGPMAAAKPLAARHGLNGSGQVRGMVCQELRDFSKQPDL